MLNTLDLFAGIGGFSLGLERTGGFRTVAFCEIDKKAQKVLNKHWPDVPVFEDVSALTKEKLDEQEISVDVITGGFPCQDISLAGKGAGLEGERSGLWFQFHRLIKEIQPKYAIIENVSALRSRGLDQVLWSLAEIGYDAEWHCIPAAAVGAPHRRDRVWIVAYPHHDGQYGSEDTQSHVAGDGGNKAGARKPKQFAGSSDLGTNLRGSATETLANAKGSKRDERLYGVSFAEDSEGWVRGEAGTSSSLVANASSKGLEGQRTREIGSRQKESVPSRSGCVVRSIHEFKQWQTEPDVGRVANGVPNRVDRLKQLGNAVVPQIPQLLGEAILAWERQA
jgi:DNA (cytosine-5)-methyltransferase 1